MASYTFWSTLTALKATYLQLMARSSSCGQHQPHDHLQEDLQPSNCTQPTLHAANTVGTLTLGFSADSVLHSTTAQHRPHGHPALHLCPLGALLHRHHWCCTPRGFHPDVVLVSLPSCQQHADQDPVKLDIPSLLTWMPLSTSLPWLTSVRPTQ